MVLYSITAITIISYQVTNSNLQANSGVIISIGRVIFLSQTNYRHIQCISKRALE
jgi:hypothetical protein